jgi:hypothetical protein
LPGDHGAGAALIEYRPQPKKLDVMLNEEKDR